MTLLYPYYLLLLLLIIPATIWYVLKRKKRYATIQVSNSFAFEHLKKSWKQKFEHIPFVLRMAAFAMMVIILGRPQSSNKLQNITTEGIDIVIALDISSSMLAEDLRPNRLEAAKKVASNFISGRPSDNIGLVVFSGESFTQCPLTTDHTVLLNLFGSLKSGIIEDGTAIGLGLANAVNRLKDSKAKSKVIILLTDGSNNMGDIDPITAADLAKTFGIRVYTIGVGRKGKAPYPFQTAYGVQYQNIEVEIDEPPLRQIAHNTGGSYYRATSNRSLNDIYNQIDQLEKTKMRVHEYNKKSEEYHLFALLAVVFLLLEIILKNTLLKRLP